MFSQSHSHSVSIKFLLRMMAVLGPCVGVIMNGHNNISNHLTKSLEKILEDAHLSGDLKLSGRKLKEFPKAVQYDLSDTVIADLSKNRLSEVPEELTTYYFLEKLSLSHNSLSSIPDRFGSLQSLTFLDLSCNQLTELPREVCYLPLQILLVNDNQLASLPKEIGRMSALLDLDASHNRLTQIPMTLGDCNSLKVLDLSNNQLGLLPLQITYLRLEHLDVSCNCISSLPLELRNMTSLVTLELENNPLVSPPITVCIKSIVHIFTYLENLANKDSTPTHKRIEDTRRTGKHSSFLGTTSQGHHITSGNATIDCLRHKPRPVIDSGYITDGMDKRWSNEAGGEAGGGGGGSGRSTPSTPSTLSPGTALSRTHSLSSESPLPTLSPMLSGLRISPPEGSMSNGTDDKNKLAQQQTYRQYKEALRQQRQQDVYRPKTDQSSPEQDSSPQHQSPSHLPKSNGLNTSSLYNRSLPNYSVSPSQVPNSPLLHSTPRRIINGNPVETYKVDELNKRPVQKVVPSRNVNKIYPSNGFDYTNGKSNGSPVNTSDSYTKPTSPIKSPTSSLYNGLGAKNMKNSVNGEPKLLTTTVSYLKGATSKPAGKMMWSKDIMSEKLSFTMKREFDKQKEETELLQQLRTIIESKLKMQLPDKLSDELCDGVVLCHLANLVRPRSIASIHVPSPAQQKLTMAKCRRNVDNFLDACRRIGVEEEDMCSPDDILRSLDCDEGAWPQNLASLARTISALLAHATPLKENNQSESTTEYTEIKTQRYIHTEERYVSNYNSNEYDFIIDEIEEYQLTNENNNADFQYSFVDNEIVRNRRPYSQKNKVQFVVPFYQRAGVISSESLEIEDTDEVDYAESTRVVDNSRYDRNKLNLNIKNNLNEQLKEIDESKPKTDNENSAYENEHRQLITCLCLGSFVISVIILFMYPL